MESFQRKLPPNPHESANWFSKIFFTWTVPFFKKGYHKVLQLDDIFQPKACDQSESLGDRLELNWNKQLSKPKPRCLLSVILMTFWKDYAILSSFFFCNDIIIRLAQPVLLGYLLRYFRNDTEITYENAFMYAVGFVLLNVLSALLNGHIHLRSHHNGMKVRVAACSLIYRKALRLSQTALGETSPGKVINLLSNDVSRFDAASFFFNALWISPLLTFIVGCLLWNEVGSAGLVGISVVLTMVPMLSYAGRLTSKYRLQTAMRTDERVRFMDEIISGVQVIKMYAWEKPFEKLLTWARLMELRVLRKTSYIRAFHMTFMFFTSRTALFCTMLTMIALYGPEEITAAKVFVASSYFGIISHLMSQRFSRSVAECAEVLVSLKRLEDFLYLEEKKILRVNEHENKNGSVDCKVENMAANVTTGDRSESSITLNNVKARWEMPMRDNISSKKKSAKGNIIKNGDIKHRNGNIQNGMVENHNGTVHDIKLAVRQAPTLDGLNVQFPKGKLIGLIGPVGAGKSSLLHVLLRELPIESGSISINGSISYASQEPWVFAASLRQNILFGSEFDRDRYNVVVQTCALTEDFAQFQNEDRTIVGERGASLSGGQKARLNLARACYREADIYLLDDPLSAVDAHVGTHIFNKCLGPKSRLAKLGATRILVTHQVHFLKEADWIVVLKDGKIEIQGTPSELAQKGVDFVDLVQMVETPDNRENCDNFKRQVSRISYLSQTHSIGSLSVESLNGSTEFQHTEEEYCDRGVPMEASSKNKVKGSLYVNYFTAGVHWSVPLIILFLFLCVQILASAADYWVSVWVKQEEARACKPAQSLCNYPSLIISTEWCTYIQGILIAALLVIAIARSIGFYSMCVRISQNVHNSMFKGLISTTMRFFDNNPSGRILNRFSRDIGAIDEFLPKSILDAVQNILSMFGSILLASSANLYFLLPVLILSMFFMVVRRVYLKTSTNVRRLEGMAKSPTFTHLAATLSGLSTVRAYNTQKILSREFDLHQDTHSACWFMVISTTSTFSFTLDLICSLFTACITFYYILFDTGASGEKIGLALTQAMNLTGMVQWGVRQSAEVSNQMTAVERVLEYRDLEPEKQPEKPLPIDDNWPSRGSIEFRNVFYRYFAEAEPVLRELSFVIKPMEKIGIVGRTGAGKSSLIGSLFHLACVEGEILVDGIDTENIPLSDLRKHIAIIPQDPVLFSGSLRRNLDPFEEYSDADIWNALESVELKNAVSDSTGLQSKVLPHGLNYSVGQRQLLCLARAILRKNRILILDEVTANVDPHTDTLIQQTIRRKFTECTVLTVAHRLHTIIDSDRVMVMDAGRTVEFDEPHNLLQNEQSVFCGMVRALGSQEFNRLSQASLEKYLSCYDKEFEISPY